ncbi:MAG: FHA domain-containing protein [Bdellovibrionales bacterium]|nr:FHA domain-containing protein [Bdellovibrionales bacterium]
MSGPLAGKSISLKLGRNVVGRAPHCEVVIPSQNISKEHTQIEIYNDKIIVTDLKSRNGTFINGVQVTSHKLQAGEKISFFDVLADIVEKSPTSIKKKIKPATLPALPAEPLFDGNLAYDQNVHNRSVPHENNEVSTPVAQKNLGAYIMKYVDEVVLPGVYKLTEWMEYRTVIALFIAAYIIFVTTLSTLPLMTILKSSIQKEAQSRAQTIARSLARDNRSAIMQGQSSLVSTENADREAGATSYVLASPNGDILAPPQLAGQYLTEINFVHEARKLNQESVKQINDDTIVAVAPIRFHNAQIGSDVTAAHAVVVYNMGSLAIDDGRTLSLFIQILFIAILLGGLLFFFLYKIILLPFNQINKQIDQALRDGQAQISSSVQLPEIQLLASNINSAVNRGAGGFASNNIQDYEVDRSLERANIVNLIGFAAITILPEDRTISTANEHFLTQIGSSGNWINLPVENIVDQALKLNIQNLIDKVISDPNQVITDQLEISNNNYDINAQGVHGTKGLAYIVVVFIPKVGGLE